MSSCTISSATGLTSNSYTPFHQNPDLKHDPDFLMIRSVVYDMCQVVTHKRHCIGYNRNIFWRNNNYDATV